MIRNLFHQEGKVLLDKVKNEQLRIVVDDGEIVLQVVDLYRNEEVATNNEGVHFSELSDKTSANNLKEDN